MITEANRIMNPAPSSQISLHAELPEELHEALLDYLEGHPTWTQDRVFSAALSLFLMQNGQCDRSVNRIYLDAIFDFAH
jgi:hypothetical protein